MEQINQNDKNKLLDFIKQNELDYIAQDNNIFKFNLTSHDKQKFHFYTYENKYVVVKYDSEKDRPGQSAYEYYYFDNMQQVLEQIKFYDDSITKTWWMPIADTIDIGFDHHNYNENWFSELLSDEHYSTEDYDTYKVVSYCNETYKPELYSPFNTLHEVSTINVQTATKLERLEFQIHPISCLEGAESYLVKISFNDEPILKEWINYKVIRKKGLRLFLNTLFEEMEKFKQK